MNFNVNKPEGCQAAVFMSEVTIKLGSGFLSTHICRVNSQIICGLIERTSLPMEWGAALLSNDRNKVIKNLKAETEEMLGAICLGCPDRLPDQSAVVLGTTRPPESELPATDLMG